MLNDSVVQRIWNSPVLSLRLKRRIKAASEGSSVGSAANLKAAKHRFESFAAPLGRMLLHLEEFLDEVQETCDDRGASKEAEDCWRWLSALDEEKLYQLGMLADCSDEILVATRQVDREDVDTSMMHDAARALLERMDALFNKRQCLEIPGYTKHVLLILKHKRIVHGPRGVLKSIGGRGADGNTALEHCFQRMAAYTALVADVVQTEFPDYELFCSFKLFNLECGGVIGPGSSNKGSDMALQRLAQAFNVEFAALKDQFYRLGPVAMQKKRDCPHICNKIAWTEAVRSCHRHHETKRRWELDALLPTLWRYVGWTAATSGVEQNFSKALRSIGPQRGSLSPNREETAVRFAVYKPDEQEVEHLINKARAIWAAHYGPPRHVEPRARCDRGTCKASGSENTETAWLNNRRSAAIEAGNKLGDAAALSIEAAEGRSGWTEGHDKEHTFQLKKRAKKELQALEDGILLPHEIRPGMQEALVDLKRRDKKADAEVKRKLQKKLSLRRSEQLTLHLKAGTVACIIVSELADDVARTLRSKGCLLSEQLTLKTQLLVVDDPANMNKLQKWTTALAGILVCSPDAVLSCDSGKCIGPFLQFKAAVASKKKLYLSQEFQNKHVRISALLQEACKLPCSSWKISAAGGAGCVVLGGDNGKVATDFLSSITCIVRAESRAR